MKKIVACLLVICCITVSLSSCGMKKIVNNLFATDELVHLKLDGTIEYSGNVYAYRDGWDEYYNFYDSDLYNHQGSIIGLSFDMHGVPGDISTTAEADFGDAILKNSSWLMTDFYFKEGFSLPNFKEVGLKKAVFTETNSASYFQSEKDFYEVDSCIVLNEFSEENVCLQDLVDFETVLDTKGNLYSSDLYISYGYIAFPLKDYETIYLGFYEIFESEEKFYVCIDSKNAIYKIREEYRQIFKNEINDYYKQYGKQIFD